MAATRATPTVPISWGELIDKVTILEIKAAKLEGAAALANVRKEMTLLLAIMDGHSDPEDLGKLKAELKSVNEALWEIEDLIRDKEAVQEFDEKFIALARSVYKQNDRRAAIKRKINQLLASELVEEKSYKTY